jgi:hypothetical protein
MLWKSILLRESRQRWKRKMSDKDDAARYHFLKAHLVWKDERDFDDGGRWTLNLYSSQKTDIDALIDKRILLGTTPT